MQRSLIYSCFLLSSLLACEPLPFNVDILIQNATILDGSGQPAYKGMIGIRGDTIAFVGPAGGNIFALQVIDANGYFVTPGFIDPHTHSLDDLLDSTRHHNLPFLLQGVTTVVNGNDGEGPVKVGETLDRLDSNGIGTNCALMVGHNSIRRLVMGSRDREPNEEELENMQKAVQVGMEQGALGFSSGLFYAPANFAKTEEVIELSRVAAGFGGLYDVHMRDESSYSIGLLNSVKETIRISAEARIPANISHIKALGTDVWGQSEAVIALIDSARQAGLSVTADQYPFRASSTDFQEAVLPRWAFADVSDYRKNLRDPETLRRLRPEIADNLRRRGGADAFLFIAASDSSINGKTLREVARSRQLDTMEATIEILLSGGGAIASFNMNEDDIKNFMAQEWVMTCSDGGSPHPRKYASFSRKIRKYVLEDSVLTLPQMVHRSSGLTAATFGIPKRGLIKEGYYADLLIFKPEEIKDPATFTEPAQYSEGMRYILLNGRIVVEGGQFNGTLAGRSIRRE